MASPNCLTSRTPGHDREQVLVTTKALVRNFQTLAFLLDSVGSAGQAETIIANIKDSLLTSFSSCLPQFGGAWQLSQELVQKTLVVLEGFRMLSSGFPKIPTALQQRAGATDRENCKQSYYPLEAWATLEKRISMEFYCLASIQALEQLKGFKHEERDRLALIAQIRDLVSCADPSGGLEKMIRKILSNPKYRGTPTGDGELSIVQEDTVISRTKLVLPDALEEAPIPPKTLLIAPTQGTEQLGTTGNRDVRLHEGCHPLGPFLPPGLIASKDPQTRRGRERPEVLGTLSKPKTSTIIKSQKKAPRDTTEVILRDPGPGQPHSGSAFKSWADTNLTSFADLYKPVLLDYLPTRGISKEDSPVLTVDSAATLFTLTTFWRDLNPTEALEIFRWTNVYRSSALNIANSYKNLTSDGDFVMPQSGSWIPLRCTRASFIRDMHTNFKQMYGESSWKGDEAFRLLNTCGTCRSLTVDSFSRPRRILDNSGRPLLQFFIRFDGINVAFQDLPRQIAVPNTQIHTSPGQTLIITPVLYDPHQTFDDLSTNTSFEVPSQFNWLRWDQVVQGFLGIVPESLLTQAHTKAIPQAQGLSVIDIPIIARTTTAFPDGVQYETRVRAQVKIWVSKSLLERNLRTWKEIAKTSSTTRPAPEPINPDTTPDGIKDGKKPPPEPEHEQYIECDGSYNAPAVLESRAVEDQPSPGDSDILAILWGQGFKEWMNIVFLASPQARGAKHHRSSNPYSGPLSFKNIELNTDGESGYPLMDRVENQIFRIGAELEISAKYCTLSQLHRNICNCLQASTGATGIYCESETKSIPSFTAIGSIDILNEEEDTNCIRGSQQGDVQSISSTHWAKIVIGKTLRLLACVGCGSDEIVKINIHVGLETALGYDLSETKTIAKAIVLFGGLLNGIGLGPDPSRRGCRADATERIRSNMKHIQAIDEASSIGDVAQLMSSLEASGYTYHGEPGPENQRYDFSCLESQGVIIWIQIFHSPAEKDIIDWISMVLFFNRAAISMDSSLFVDFAEKPIILASLNRFIAKG